MRTFDQAVTLVLTAPDLSDESIDHLLELQMAFKSEACANAIVRESIMTITAQLVSDISAIEDDDQAIQQHLPALLAGGLMSTMMWGIAIGREMEKAEMPAL